MVLHTRYTKGICRYCDRPSITLEPGTGWCADCRHAHKVGGGPTDAERMRDLLDRLEEATSAGLRADDLEVALIVQEWRHLKGRAA